MKIYISADIEGTAGITHWDETYENKPDYQQFRKQMTAETAAACEGAVTAGAHEIYVKDAHGNGRNILADKLPKNVKLIRGWSEHPFMMMQELDESFDAVLLIGYHSRAGSDANPLAHTMNPQALYVKLNDSFVSEFVLSAYTAAMVGVPVVFVSGDQGLCEEVKSFNSNIRTVAVSEGAGNSTISIHPKLAVDRIKEESAKALQNNTENCRIELPGHFKIEIAYKTHRIAYKTSFYPNARLTRPNIITLESDDFMDILRMMLFTI